MIWTVVILLMGILNRVRGGGLYGHLIPFKALYAVAPCVGLVALLAGHPWTVSLTFAIAYLLWALPAWGRWFDLGYLPDNYGRDPDHYADPLERWIDKRSGDDLEAMILRHGIMGSLAMFLVFIVALNPFYLVLVPVLPWLIVNSYVMAWRHAEPDMAIPAAEILTGMSWGVVICLTSMFN